MVLPRRFKRYALAVAALIMLGFAVPSPAQTVEGTVPPDTAPVTTPPATTVPPTTLPPLTPSAYVADALTFIETYAYRVPQVEWPTIKNNAQQKATTAPSIPDTYPIIIEAVKALADKHSSFTKPPEAAIQSQGNVTGFGFLATMPSRVVVTLAPGGPAERAGLRLGDRVELVDGKPPKDVGGAVGIVRRPDGSVPDTTVIRVTRALVPGLTIAASTTTPAAPTTTLPKGKLTKAARAKAAKAAKLAAKAKATSATPPPTSVTLDITIQRGTVTLVSIPNTQPPPQVVVLPSLGYLSVPGIVGDANAQKNFAMQLQNAIREQDTGTRCGWIVDLRKNRGGYIYALLAGLAPLLGEGPAGGSRSANGVITQWTYRNGAVFAGDQQQVTVDQPYLLKTAGAPIAVLTSGLTASAGEASTIFFRGLPNARSFGDSTLGLTTFNVRKTMADGAFLDITASVDVDRNGVAYEGKIAPDEPVAIDWAAISTGNDATLQAASTWLRAQPQCANLPA